ncbi:MAG: putative manganese-dependent inorganic diphosphatase [Acidobacteria bacterium]|nr:MAG: putative manganese-dependent inorganic diphosphatase [Acidobacteriota bacterium]GIK77065.1 MAG: inorganic pyrophosphatase [Actinomycetes bacterium]
MLDDSPAVSSEEPIDPRRRRIYVTGHRNPDTDSIASAIAYAELKQQLDPDSEYVPVRLGRVNAQTAWALERSGARLPERMGHVFLRVRDVMREDFPVAGHGEPLREVGRTMAADDLDIVPIVGDEGELVGVMTERALAHRYIRETGRTHSLADAPTTISAIVAVLDGELVEGEDGTVAGRVWVHSIDAARSRSRISDGDVVVVGNRLDAQRQSIELGAAVLIASNGIAPEPEIRELARERRCRIVVSPLDSYVSCRMVTLASPCEGLADREPLTVDPDDLIVEISEQVKDVHYRAAVAVDGRKRPVGLLTRSDLVAPRPRRVILVDHAEAAQSVPGVEQAEIVEILDHHHIGSIETRIPVTATFDPVGSTATLIAERYAANGVDPMDSTAIMLLCAILSDTVLLNSPTTTDRDRDAINELEDLVDVNAIDLGREMFASTSDVTELTAREIVTRDAKEYTLASGETVSIAQIETVGGGVLERREELTEAIAEVRERNGHSLAALMVTDILARGTTLIASGDEAPLRRAFGDPDEYGLFELPGVMSRKKQVAPVLLGA